MTKNVTLVFFQRLLKSRMKLRVKITSIDLLTIVPVFIFIIYLSHGRHGKYVKMASVFSRYG